MQLEALILGIVQGATEFLPISSSGHLVIAQALMKIQSPGLLLEVVLHLGTLASILVYFRRDIGELIRGFFAPAQGRETRREAAYLVLATLPAVTAALLLDESIEAAFENVNLTGVMLLVTTLVLLSTRWARAGRDPGITWWVALLIGLAQAVAILPGISRSGATIAAGLWLGLTGLQAARFSFLLAIPVLIGAGLFHLADLLQSVQSGPEAAAIQSSVGLLIGFLAAALVGYAVIAWLLGILRRGRLYVFAAYTLVIGIVVIFRL